MFPYLFYRNNTIEVSEKQEKNEIRRFLQVNDLRVKIHCQEIEWE
jgi:hypothetical protein